MSTLRETCRLFMLRVNAAQSVNGLNPPDWYDDADVRREYDRIQALARQAYEAAEESISACPTTDDRWYTEAERAAFAQQARALYVQAYNAWHTWCHPPKGESAQ